MKIKRPTAFARRMLSGVSINLTPITSSPHHHHQSHPAPEYRHGYQLADSRDDTSGNHHYQVNQTPESVRKANALGRFNQSPGGG
jgi:hypothetical protein